MNHKIILDMFIFEVSYLNVYYLITNNGNINLKFGEETINYIK